MDEMRKELSKLKEELIDGKPGDTHPHQKNNKPQGSQKLINILL